MKFSKKLLSLFLAVVMVLSTFVVMAAAYTTVDSAVSGNINVKYSVEKVSTVPANEDAGSEEYTADNIYAVTIWMQCDEAVDVFTAPVHYNKTHFAPIMAVVDGATIPYGSGLSQDSYATEATELGIGSGLYAYTHGDYMKNTLMYKADGSTTTSKLSAKCIGLGSASSAGVTVNAELVSPDHELYNKWGAGLPENTGVLYVNLDVSSKAKTAYLNTISGIEADTGWNKMFTLYFESITDANVYGDEFGCLTDDCFTVDGTTDEYAGYFTAATTVVAGNPTKNVVSNATATPVVNYTSQIRYTGAVDGDYAPFDIRSRAGISADEFAALCGDDAAAEEAIKAVGFVYTDGSVAFCEADAEAAIAAKATTGAYVYKECTEIVKDATNGRYFWSCMITGAEYEGTMNAYGFITVGDKTYFVNVDQFTDFNVLYDAYAENIPA